MSFSGWMVKEIMVHPYYVILIKKKNIERRKRRLLTYTIIWMNRKEITTISKDACYMIPFIKYSWNNNYRDGEQISGSQELERGVGVEGTGVAKRQQNSLVTELSILLVVT